MGTQQIVAAAILTMRNATITMEDDATSKALWIGESARAVGVVAGTIGALNLSSRASIRNLQNEKSQRLEGTLIRQRLNEDEITMRTSSTIGPGMYDVLTLVVNTKTLFQTETAKHKSTA